MADGPGPAIDWPAFSLTPDEFAVMQKYERAVLRLRWLDRHLYLHHRCHGTSYAELARRTGLTPVEVERRMARAVAGIDRYMSRPEPRWWHWPRWWPF